MSTQLRFYLIIGSLLFFIFILRFIKKSKMSLNMASLWVVWGLGIIIIAFFPELMIKITRFLGIQSQMNSLFLIMITILYMFCFYLFVKVSILEEKLKNLIQRVGLENIQNKNKN